MKVRIDVHACSGHGRCQALAPSVFSLNDEGYNVTPEQEIAGDLEDAARLGALSCPEHAIEIDDDRT